MIVARSLRSLLGNARCSHRLARPVDLPNTEEITRHVVDLRDFLKDVTLPERKALSRYFVDGIDVMGDEATLTYSISLPSDGATSESASVLDRTMNLSVFLHAEPAPHPVGPGQRGAVWNTVPRVASRSGLLALGIR